MSPGTEITFEILKVLSPLLALLLTWLVGYKLLHKWEIIKKKKESDMATMSEFYKLYGEFTSVWRLWKVHHKINSDKNTQLAKSQENFWELLERSSNVEGGMEAVFVKLASEKKLKDNQLKSLGLFRQAIQQLRQSIRNDEKMDWQRHHTEYKLLKKLSVFTANLINVPTDENMKNDYAANQLSKITEVNSKDWRNETGEEKSYWYENYKNQDKENIEDSDDVV